MLVPERPSRRVLMTGIAAPTAASKLSAPPCFSAECASRNPCLAISALFAVTTDLPDFNAVSIADSAGSPEPPISSTRQSMVGSLASSCGFLAQAMPSRLTARFFALERAVTATTRTPRPMRADKARPCSSMRRTTSAPTVPSPAIPTFRGATMAKRTSREGFFWARLDPKTFSILGSSPRTCNSGSYLTPIGERNYVVQCFKAAFKEAADAAGSLADTLLVFHHGDPDKALAMLAEGNAG